MPRNFPKGAILIICGQNALKTCVKESKIAGGDVKEFVSEIKVEWAHCDFAGIVFYPTFYIWFDQGTERLFRANGLSYPELGEQFGIDGMPLLETGTAYKNASKLGADLTITSWIDAWEGKTFVVRHRIMHADGREALEGFERRIFVIKDPALERGIKAIAVPDELRARFTD
jgi:4-hydroxybenzoyl-CoA thioesterase